MIYSEDVDVGRVCTGTLSLVAIRGQCVLAGRQRQHARDRIELALSGDKM